MDTGHVPLPTPGSPVAVFPLPFYQLPFYRCFLAVNQHVTCVGKGFIYVKHFPPWTSVPGHNPNPNVTLNPNHMTLP